MMNLRESVGKQATDNLLRTVHHVPVVDYSRLLTALVPDGAHDQECGLAHGLEYAEQRPDSDKSWEAEASSVAAEGCAP